jgi:4-hydroxy-2-oxoheptanedioate aldolase
MGYIVDESGAPILSAARPNRLKRRLADGKVTVGCLLAYGAPWLVEVLGMTGYDFVTIDLEHELIDDQAVTHLVRAADAVGLTTIVRMPASERLFPFLSAGVQGVQIPDLRDRAHAEQVVELTRFPPLGRRTYYTQTRSAQYGVGIDERTWTGDANNELLVIGMIEHVELVDQLDDILSIDGIDGFHIGVLDLAQSLGSPPPERLEEVVADVIARCREAGRFVAVGVVAPWSLDGVAKRVNQGVHMMSVPSAWLITHAIGSFLGEIESRIPDGKRDPTARTVTPNQVLSISP